MLASFWGHSQSPDSLLRFTLFNDVLVAIDLPVKKPAQHETMLIFYALSNGNTIEQTIGKRLLLGDDWHFDIQHIKSSNKIFKANAPS